jgi:hypothetical protein
VLYRNLVESAVDAALEKREGILNRVRVNSAPRIALFVVNDAMTARPFPCDYCVVSIAVRVRHGIRVNVLGFRMPGLNERVAECIFRKVKDLSPLPLESPKVSIVTYTVKYIDSSPRPTVLPHRSSPIQSVS